MTASRGTRVPDFLVIGAARCGTTWLHRVLRRHPALWLPPVKELHYFDQLTAGRTWHQRRWRRLRRTLMSGRGILDPWHLRHVFGKCNDEWYASLFRRGRSRGALTGEITPAYARLDEETLERIRRVNPEVALIFIMRDPVNRAWSSVNAGFRESPRAGPLTLTYALEHSQRPGSVARSAYTETIRRVEEVFAPTQIHYCFFDELKDQPERFVTGILTFLGVNSDGVGRLLPKGAVNSAAGSSPIPFEFQHKIAAQYLPMVEELCQRFDGPPQQWRARYRKLLSKAEAKSAV